MPEPKLRDIKRVLKTSDLFLTTGKNDERRGHFAWVVKAGLESGVMPAKELLENNVLTTGQLSNVEAGRKTCSGLSDRVAYFGLLAGKADAAGVEVPASVRTVANTWKMLKGTEPGRK